MIVLLAMTQKLTPNQTAPTLTVPTVNGKTWTLADETPPNYTMIVFYRGLHCPICQTYLADLEDKLDQFKDLGLELSAPSRVHLIGLNRLRSKQFLEGVEEIFASSRNGS